MNLITFYINILSEVTANSEKQNFPFLQEWSWLYWYNRWNT